MRPGRRCRPERAGIPRLFAASPLLDGGQFSPAEATVWSIDDAGLAKIVDHVRQFVAQAVAGPGERADRRFGAARDRVAQRRAGRLELLGQPLQESVDRLGRLLRRVLRDVAKGLARMSDFRPQLAGERAQHAHRIRRGAVDRGDQFVGATGQQRGEARHLLVERLHGALSRPGDRFDASPRSPERVTSAPCRREAPMRDGLGAIAATVLAALAEYGRQLGHLHRARWSRVDLAI